MAGIGFKLQKLISGESYTDLIRAYLYSSIITSGPLLVIMMTILLIRQGIAVKLNVEEGALFLGLVMYVYTFSMIVVSPFLYGVTRYLADSYYKKDYSTFAPTYLAVLEILFPLQSGIGLFFLFKLDLSFNVVWLVLALYLFVTAIWIAMLMLSAARSYLWIVGAFVGGSLFGALSASFFGKQFGFVGFFGGFTLGQGLTFFILTARIFSEFGFERSVDFGFLSYFSKHPYLVLVGVFYYLGLWIDKLIFWFSGAGNELRGWMRVCYDYDTPLFLAFLTIIPSMAFFLVQMETSFVRYYQAYYLSIRKRDSLDYIEEKRHQIMEVLALHFQKFVMFQGVISGIIIIFVADIADAFYLNSYQVGIFRIGILGSFLQMGFIMILCILFYFDFQKDAFLIAFVYFVSNAVFTYLSIGFGIEAYGFGFAMAAFITLVTGFLIMDHKLKDLDYWTFMRQPILIPKFKLEGEKSIN